MYSIYNRDSGADSYASSYPTPPYINTQQPPQLASVDPHGNHHVSRTVILKHIVGEVSLSQLLDHIDYGPIEYCKMYKKQTDPQLLARNPSLPPQMQQCSIAFVNGDACRRFHTKYAKSITNLRKLKSQLANSERLQIVIADTHGEKSHPDFIKLKTLNYILQQGATRCVDLEFTLDDIPLDLVFTQEEEATASAEECAHKFIYDQCAKWGEIDKFDVQMAEDMTHGHCQVQFTSIDSAIKTVEFYTKRIQNDRQRTEDGIQRKSKFRYDIKFISVGFGKDRCDRNGGADDVPPPSTPPPASPLPLEHEHMDDEREQREDEHEQAAQGDATPGTRDDGAGLEEPVLPLDKEVISPPSSTERMSPIIAMPSSGRPSSSPSSFLGMGASSSVTSGSRMYHYQPDMLPTPPERSFPLYMDQYPSYEHMPPMPYPHHAPHGHPHLPHGAPDHHGSAAAAVAAAQTAANAANAAAAAAAAAASQYSGSLTTDPYNVENRSIYLGNLHPNTTVEEIANNVRAGGLVESIRFHPEKKMCFITFVDAKVAWQFYVNHQVHHQLIIHGFDVTVGWAKNHSGPLLREVAAAVQAGASRNVYIGIRMGKEKHPSVKVPPEEILRRDFSKIGEVEQINFFHNKDCGFVNFLNLSDAVRAVSIFELPEEECRAHLDKIFKTQASQIYDRYHRLKISFAKDRCGNPPKFSFKKKIGGLPGSTYQQYQDQLHTQVEQRKRQEAMRAMMALSERQGRRQNRYKKSHKPVKNDDDEEEGEVEEEEVVATPLKSDGEEHHQPDQTKPKGEKTKEEQQNEDDDDDDDDDEVEEETQLTLEASNGRVTSEVSDDVPFEDSDDDLSIIIDSDENSANTTPVEAPRKKQGRNKKNYRNRNKFDYQSRNSSSGSLSYYRTSPYPAHSPGLYYQQQRPQQRPMGYYSNPVSPYMMPSPMRMGYPSPMAAPVYPQPPPPPPPPPQRYKSYGKYEVPYGVPMLEPEGDYFSNGYAYGKGYGASPYYGHQHPPRREVGRFRRG